MIKKKNVMAIPKAATEKNARMNFDIFDFELDEKDREAIDQVGHDVRLVNPSWAPVWDQAA